MLTKHWRIAPSITPEADQNLAAYPSVLRSLLFNRGYATEAAAKAFLAAEPDFDTDPWQLMGMSTAVDRIRYALSHGESIAIYGDYDVDGVTATALMLQTLEHMGGEVIPYIPNRFEEGYGLNREALSHLKNDNGVKLVITVDCGIRSPDEALFCREIGLDLIISDHHHPLEGSLPPALAVVNPKQPGDSYPDKHLAGVGIAYKIAQGLIGDQGASAGDSSLRLEDLQDLVALGTVADLAPLVGENRALVRRGLREIRRTRRQGLYSLAAAANMEIGSTTAGQIGFILGPRLNAAGRLESAKQSLELLCTSDRMRAGQIAQELDVQNRKRQELTRQTQEKAEALAIAEEPNPILLFAADEAFNPGVVGLAASRLAEVYYRPAIVAAKGPDETRGSCRSIPEFHITDALDKCADLLVRHGGHMAAAGFTVQNKNLPELINRLKALAQEQLGTQELRPTLLADRETQLSDLDFDLLSEISRLEPTGYGNPDARFVSRGAKVRTSRAVGAEGKHLKLTLEDERGATVDAIGFRLGDLREGLPQRVDVIYALESNEYNGRTSLQLNLKDIKPAGTAD
jgi:single-stranded-DNA-specific exonuclease